MTPAFFTASTPLRFEGKDSRNPMAFQWYDKDQMVLGRRMEDHLRFAVA
jgi:xylose isomerase